MPTRLCTVEPSIWGSQFRTCFRSSFWRPGFLGVSFGPFGHPWSRDIPPSSIRQNFVMFIHGQVQLSCLSQKRTKDSSRREHLDKTEALPGQVSVALCSTVCITLLSFCVATILSAAQERKNKEVVYLSSFITAGLWERRAQSLRARLSTQQNNDCLMENIPRVSRVLM